MTHKKKRRKGKLLVSTLRLLLAPLAAFQNALLHIRDGVVQTLVFAGLMSIPSESAKRSRKRRKHRAKAEPSTRDQLQALTQLENAERRRNRKEVAIRNREARLLSSKSQEAKEFQENRNRSICSFSKGAAVNHLFKMQQQANADRAKEKARQEKAQQEEAIANIQDTGIRPA